MVYVLRERGEWSRADAGSAASCSPRARTPGWAEELLGVIHGFQGKLGSARRMLVSSLAASEPLGHFHMLVDATAGLAYVAAAGGRPGRGGRALPGNAAAGAGTRERGSPLLHLGAALGVGLPRAQRRPRRSARLRRGPDADRLARGHPLRTGRARARDRRDDAARGGRRHRRRAALPRRRGAPQSRRAVRTPAGRAAGGDRAGGHRRACRPALERLGASYRQAPRGSFQTRPLASEARRWRQPSAGGGGR